MSNLAPTSSAYAGITAGDWYEALEFLGPCGRHGHPAVWPEDLEGGGTDMEVLARAIARMRGVPYTVADLQRELAAERAEARGEQPCGLACELGLVRYAREAWSAAPGVIYYLGEAIAAAQEGHWAEAVAALRDARRVWPPYRGHDPLSATVARAIRADWRASR